MKALGDLFSSAAKTEILRALHHQPDRAGLRHLARIADVRVRSAEMALDSLVKAKLVRRIRTANRAFYSLIRSDPRASVLAGIFDAAAVASIREKCQSLDRRAKSILPFIRQATRMLDHARGAHHDA